MWFATVLCTVNILKYKFWSLNHGEFFVDKFFWVYFWSMMTSRHKYDDVTPWRRIPRYCPFVRECTDNRWFPSQRASNAGFDVFCYVGSNEYLNKPPSDLTRHDTHCDVTIMNTTVIYSLGQWYWEEYGILNKSNKILVYKSIKGERQWLHIP